MMFIIIIKLTGVYTPRLLYNVLSGLDFRWIVINIAAILTPKGVKYKRRGCEPPFDEKILLSQCLAGIGDAYCFVALGGDYKGVLDGLADFRLLVDDFLVILGLADSVLVPAVYLELINIFQPLELLAVQGDFCRT
jgi:hypothetical protein